MKCFDPKVDRRVRLGSQQYQLNDKFYVKKISDWDEQLRDWLACRENLELGAEHYFVIDCLRTYFTNHRVHPVVRTVTFALREKFGAEKGSIKHFHALFPGGIHQAFLVAGLPMVDSCC